MKYLLITMLLLSGCATYSVPPQSTFEAVLWEDVSTVDSDAPAEWGMAEQRYGTSH